MFFPPKILPKSIKIQTQTNKYVWTWAIYGKYMPREMEMADNSVAFNMWHE